MRAQNLIFFFFLNKFEVSIYHEINKKPIIIIIIIIININIIIIFSLESSRFYTSILLFLLIFLMLILNIAITQYSMLSFFLSFFFYELVEPPSHTLPNIFFVHGI